MDEAHSDHDAYLSKVCDFINSQAYLQPINADVLRRSRMTKETGITSLGAIALVANYLISRGLSDSDLKPEWVPTLDEVRGIVAVFREIDSLSNQPVVA